MTVQLYLKSLCRHMARFESKFVQVFRFALVISCRAQTSGVSVQSCFSSDSWIWPSIDSHGQWMIWSLPPNFSRSPRSRQRLSSLVGLSNHTAKIINATVPVFVTIWQLTPAEIIKPPGTFEFLSPQLKDRPQISIHKLCQIKEAFHEVIM